MHDPLRETLLRGDPADGDQLSQPERQRMWQRILAVAVNPRPARVRWPVTVAAVAAFVSAVALVVWLPWPSRPKAPATASVLPSTTAPTPPPTKNNDGRRQQLQYTTPRGTRIIWSINPDLSI